MYALFIICNAFLPMRLDDNIANISKERFSEQYAKISRGGSVPPHLFHRKKKERVPLILILTKKQTRRAKRVRRTLHLRLSQIHDSQSPSVRRHQSHQRHAQLCRRSVRRYTAATRCFSLRCDSATVGSDVEEFFKVVYEFGSEEACQVFGCG